MLDIGVLMCIWSNIAQSVQNLYKFTEKH